MLVSAEEVREQHLRDEWEKLNRIAIERGYKPGWVFHRFKEKFGRLPPTRTTVTAAPTEPRSAAFARIQAQERNPVWASLRYRVEFGEAPPST